MKPAAVLPLTLLATSVLIAAPLCAQDPAPSGKPPSEKQGVPQKKAERQGPPAAKNAPSGSQYALPTAAEDEAPFSKPFRTFLPKKDFELAKGWLSIFQDADEMFRVWRDAPTKSFDEEGRPTSSSPHFATMRARLEKNLVRQGAMLRIYRAQGTNSARRRAAIFSSLFVSPMQDSVHLLRLLPYEPVPALRHEMIRLSMKFLETQVGSMKHDARGRPTSPSFIFDAAPWIDLTRSPKPIDRTLALEVLIKIGEARGEALRMALPLMKAWIPDLLRDRSSAVRANARAFLTVLEPEARFPEDADKSVEYFQRVYKKLFPPIRLAKSRGFCELFESEEFDKLVTDCEDVLRDGSATRVESRKVRKRFGSFDRQGIRIVRVTPSMSNAGLDTKMLLTSLDGQPITSPGDLLERLEIASRSKKTKFVLEWITPKGEERARVYHLRPREK